MVRTRFGTLVMLITFVCFLALILPCWVPSVGSRVTLPEDGRNDPPGSDGADPDDIAVNSSRDGSGFGDKGQFEVGEGRCVVLVAEGDPCSEEASAASVRRDSERWLWLVWSLTRQLVLKF
ncbi:MAG: hypothetical protein JSW03_00670 [Candidatus Eiseniibacteriota bacterium]|nr:MAG: hypothetical protein JSW03_00670 [Candidatus Eisenbacteria bacterium]